MSFLPVAFLSAFLLGGCHALQRDNPVDPGGAAPAAEALSLVVPLTKALATTVDSLVARLEGPDMTPVVKLLDYDTPLGPARLTIGAVSPGSGRTLTVEGYDQQGRLILFGQQRNITIAAGDTTRVSIDLRLQIAPEELEAATASQDTAAQG